MIPDEERRPISFRNWQPALAAARLPPGQEREFRRVILAFLHRCKAAHAPATIAFARQYLRERDAGAARDALRWFVTQGRARPRESFALPPPDPANGPRRFDSI